MNAACIKLCDKKNKLVLSKYLSKTSLRAPQGLPKGSQGGLRGLRLNKVWHLWAKINMCMNKYEKMLSFWRWHPFCTVFYNEFAKALGSRWAVRRATCNSCCRKGATWQRPFFSFKLWPTRTGHNMRTTRILPIFQLSIFPHHIRDTMQYESPFSFLSTPDTQYAHETRALHTKLSCVSTCM